MNLERASLRCRRLVGALLLGSLAAAGCQGAGATAGPGALGSEPVAPQHVLRIVTNDLPNNFSLRPLAGGGGATGVAEASAAYLLNATLAVADEHARTSPYLAETLPQLDTNSWQLLPDGTMETTYRLKGNLIWHDGSPLTADDFVFAWQVYATPEYGVDRSVPIRYISSVDAPDSRTVVIHWKQRYVDAGRLQESFPALPRHILEPEQRQGTAEKILNSSFWNASYLGAGPYKLDSFEPGVSIEVSAFDAHVLGRPKINRVNIRGIPDINTALAAVLAGEVDFGNDLFRAEEGLVLERDWVSTGAGVVLWEPLGSRTLNFQFRPELAQPAEIATDVRVRRALAHAIDKRESFDVVTGGHGIMVDTRTLPGEEYQPLVDREVTKYPYDPRRAVQLLVEAGFTQAPAGQWQTPRGGPAELPIWYTGGSSLFERENLIIVDQLKRFGFEATSNLFPSSGSSQDRAQLPGMHAVGSADPTGYRSIFIPTPENRWTGANRGAYSNPELDRVGSALDMAIAPAEIIQLTIQLEKLVSSDLPGIFLYYHSRAWVHIASLKGPKVRQAVVAGHPLRTIYQWEWIS